MNIMIDLETMGTKPGSAIIAIGAVMFDTREGVYGNNFYTNVSLGDCMKRGLTVDASTIGWWMQQDDAARKKLVFNQCSLWDTLCKFRTWTSKFPDIDEDGWSLEPSDVTLWGCGPDFDIALLEAAFRACDIAWPFLSHRYRDVRTVRDFAPIDYDPPSRVGLHDALADATYEAQIVVDIARLRKVELL